MISMDRHSRKAMEATFSSDLTLQTFIDAQEFAKEGLERDGGHEMHNVALAFGASYKVTVINHATMGVASYITEISDGKENTYAVPPVHTDPEGMMDSELFPQYFPDTTGKEKEFLACLKMADTEKAFVLSGVMRYLAGKPGRT